MEIWKDIKDFEGYYQVSDAGNVKRLHRLSPNKSYGYRTLKEMPVAKCRDSQGYLISILNKDGVKSHKLVHRLVAQAFIPNPCNLPEVNHIFGIKSDNRASQLAWSTASDNQKHSYQILGRKSSAFGKFGKDNSHSISVRCTTLGLEFNSFREAANALGIHSSAVSMVCSGERNHAAGLVFEAIR